MALITGYPLFRAFGDDGSPLVGGLLNTYVAGTTTPKATYADAAETTPNANPVVLDSRGEALVYLLQDEAYKFVLTDADGAAVVTVDNVGASLLTSTFGVEHNIATGVHEFPGTRAAGDVFYDDGTDVVRLAKSAGKFLVSGSSAPAWASLGVYAGEIDVGMINGFVVSRSSDTELTITGGELVIDDGSTKKRWYKTDATVKAHGISAGAFTVVYVYVDPDAASGGTWPVLNASNFVVSATAPTRNQAKGNRLYHPTSADQRCVGCWPILSTNVSASYHAIDGETVYFDAQQAIVAGANHTSETVYQIIPSVVVLPAVATGVAVMLRVASAYASAAGSANWRTSGGGAGAYQFGDYATAGGTNVEHTEWYPYYLNAGAPSIGIKVDNAGMAASFWARGWRLKR